MTSKEKILNAALKLAEESHYKKVPRGKLAKLAEISESTVQYHFPKTKMIPCAILLYAIRKKNLTVLAQGLGALDNIALTAPAGLREKTLKMIKAVAEKTPKRKLSCDLCRLFPGRNEK